jgi:GntR family transcriptional repressor for pyruvate dehydrogenase complex
MQFTRLPRNPVYKQVAAHLRDAILNGEIAPGSQIPTERELSETFGVSRTSVREALRALETQGLLSSTGRTSVRWVSVPTGDGPLRTALSHLVSLGEIELGDLIEVRCALEGAALTLAAQHPEAATMSTAEEALREMQSLDGSGLDRFDSADVRFHLALTEAAGNRAIHVMMLAIRDEIGRHLRGALSRLADRDAVLARLGSEHANILRAVRNGEGAAAAKLVRDHITSFYQQAAQSTPRGR